MEKADSATKVFYPTDSMETRFLGFDHMLDVLKQDLAEGRIRPEQLSKVSIEQAVRRVHEYDQERKKAMAQASLKATEGMPVHKDYGDGFKWIELAPKKPDVEEPLPEGYQWLEPKNGVQRLQGPSILSDRGRVYLGNTQQEALEQAHKRDAELSEKSEKPLREALKYEGDTMGHCVGGYCPSVASGETRIFSLRDAKNEPHVTIEVRPHKIKTWDDVTKSVGQEQASKLWKEFDSEGGYNVSDVDHAFDYFINKKGIEPHQSIKQIKGKEIGRAHV